MELGFEHFHVHVHVHVNAGLRVIRKQETSYFQLHVDDSRDDTDSSNLHVILQPSATAIHLDAIDGAILRLDAGFFGPLSRRAEDHFPIVFRVTLLRRCVVLLQLLQ